MRRALARRLLFGALLTGFVILAIAYALHERSVANLRSAQLATGERLREIVNGPEGYGASAFTGVFYAGSDDHCDYIAIRYGDLGVRVHKTRRGEVDLKHRMRIRSDEQAWVDVTNRFPSPP